MSILGNRDKNIVLIPFWIEDNLKRNKLPLATCLDFVKMKSLVSLNDLVTFSTLQQYFKRIMGVDESGSLAWNWSDSIPNDQPELSKYYWNTFMGLESDKSFHKEVEARLFDEHARTDSKKEPFITYDLTPNVCGVVINPGFFTAHYDEQLNMAVVEAVLKVLYVYSAPHTVASSTVFKRYLELLSVN